MSDATFQAPVGTHDVLGPESQLWEGVVATFAQLAYRYGFSMVVSPLFEDVGVFHRGIGEERRTGRSGAGPGIGPVVPGRGLGGFRRPLYPV